MKPAKRHRTTRRPTDAPRSNYLSPIKRSIRDGLRWVEPYDYEFRAYAKGRWVGRKLIDVCEAEFVAQPREYYEKAIIDGRITIGEKTVNIPYVLDHNDLIIHRTRCTENPVSGEEIKTIVETDKFLVVSKPSSLPIHACGGYRLNTLVSLLQYERKEEQELLPAHRIDRLTSGLVILGKTPEAARDIGGCIMDNSGDKEVFKEYLALAKGHVESARTIKGYIKCTDFRVGKFVFLKTEQSDCKYSETTIEPLKYYEDRNESLVKCRPITGRTHQIRLHLQSIGHPIVNDVCYGGVFDAGHPHAIRQIPSVQHDTYGKLFCGGIFLHAFHYHVSALKLDVQADLPSWATDHR